MESTLLNHVSTEFYQHLQKIACVYRKVLAFTKQGLVSQVTHLYNIMYAT